GRPAGRETRHRARQGRRGSAWAGSGDTEIVLFDTERASRADGVVAAMAPRRSPVRGREAALDKAVAKLRSETGCFVQ
ncbi:hypothetical protein ACS0ZG_37195, partial [Burkholderia gladioli]